MHEQYFNRLLEFVKEAGTIACDLIKKSDPALKKDQSVITEADLAISKLAQKHLKDLLDQGDHILIDEEDPSHADYLSQELLSTKNYIWALDPIDGTRPYANQMPYFAVSLGLIKDLKPWMGAVYFPGLNELFYSDSKEAYFIQNVFSKEEKRTVIKPIHQEISSLSVMLCSDMFYKVFQWESKDCHVIIPACAAVDLCWPSVGRGCGALLKSSLWDFAGSWPVFQAAGLALREYESGRILDQLQVEHFDTHYKPWKLKDFYILSSDENYPHIKKRLKRVKK